MVERGRARRLAVSLLVAAVAVASLGAPPLDAQDPEADGQVSIRNDADVDVSIEVDCWQGRIGSSTSISSTLVATPEVTASNTADLPLGWTCTAIPNASSGIATIGYWHDEGFWRHAADFSRTMIFTVCLLYTSPSPRDA